MSKLRCKTRVPKVFIDEPFAALRTPARGDDREAWEAGKTETSAPVSMRKGLRRCRQKRESEPTEEGALLTEERVPEEKGATDPRLCRFPKDGQGRSGPPSAVA